ncbi:hypothetical protein TSUD_210680 [Trifolium subterraneum]|uniref:Uncharacterized protein n=1 Tax=Trifolium subterraneum TaxID=3900 RepID=A0A2Z6MHG3_TRISU|nr:hypothetical protein TSUD_210680 [Trifolium subterraneum]
MERFPFLARRIKPTGFPLSVRWIEEIHKYFKPCKRKDEQMENTFDNMMLDQINWSPYDPIRLQMTEKFEDQLLLRYAVVPCINFYTIHMVRPDICYRQLGLEADEVGYVKIPTERKFVKPSVHKGMDLRCYGGYDTGKKKKEYNYAEFNKMWDDRFKCLVINATWGCVFGIRWHLELAVWLKSS